MSEILIDNNNKTNSNPIKIFANPNTLGKGRKWNRQGPKTENLPRNPPPETKIFWAEPNPDAPPVQICFTDQIDVSTESAIQITLRPKLPENLASQFSDFVVNVGQQKLYDESRLETVSDLLTAQTYLKSARKLYATLETIEQSALSPMKSVFYDDTPLPIHLCYAISMIGDFDSKIGKAKIKHSETLFLRWVTAALTVLSKYKPDPDLPDHSVDWERILFPIKDSLKLAKEKALDALKIQERVVTTIQVDQTSMRVTPPHFDPNLETPIGYIHGLSDRFDNYDRLVRLASIFQLTPDDLAEPDANIPSMPFPVTVEEALGEAGLLPTPIGCDLKNLNISHDKFQRYYRSVATPLMKSFFDLAVPPSSEVGYPAQIAQGYGNRTLHSKLPLSAADKLIGYVFKPAEDVELRPILETSSVITPDVYEARIAEKSIRKCVY